MTQASLARAVGACPADMEPRGGASRDMCSFVHPRPGIRRGRDSQLVEPGNSTEPRWFNKSELQLTGLGCTDARMYGLTVPAPGGSQRGELSEIDRKGMRERAPLSEESIRRDTAAHATVLRAGVRLEVHALSSCCCLLARRLVLGARMDLREARKGHASELRVLQTLG